MSDRSDFRSTTRGSRAKERIGPQGGDYTAMCRLVSIYACEKCICVSRYLYGVALDAGDGRVWVSLTRYYCSDTTRHGVTHDLPWGSIDIIYNVGTNCHAVYIRNGEPVENWLGVLYGASN